jgi:signal transduction histidine kinase/HAMP domain-containing protein
VPNRLIKRLRETRMGSLGHVLGAAAMTIRGKILLAFCALAAITGFVGLSAINSVVESGDLVVQTYDKPLMSISYARLALSDFTTMQMDLGDRVRSDNLERQKTLDARMDELAQSVAEDLAVTEERSLSPRAATAAHNAAAAASEWDALRRKLIDGVDDVRDRGILQSRAATIRDDFDNLVEFTAEDGFKDRERALASIEYYRRISILTTIGALFLGMLIASFLARRMVRPIAAASEAAERIAQGELDVEIGTAGSDELGQLLGSMAVMRDNIRGMMQREIAARRSAQTRLVNAIEGTAEGVVLVDDAGKILISNSRIASFFPDLGLSVGAPLPVDVEKALAVPGGELGLPDGRWLGVSRSATSDGGFVVIVSDISVLKEREIMLQKAKDQAEAANRAKTEFLGNMGHELRTPLNAVIGFSEIIAKEMFGPVGQPSYKDFATDIQRSGNHLLEIINDILDIAKCEGGNLQIAPEPVDLDELFSVCAEAQRAPCERGQLTLTVTPLEAPMWLLADPARIRRILQHLLSNAVKFTPAGGQIHLAATRHAAGWIALTVSDTGIGMRQEDIPKALAPFGQIDGSLSRKYEGAGLGLPLCQVFAALHGGKLLIESEPGKGTRVTVILPEAIHETQSLAVAS